MFKGFYAKGELIKADHRLYLLLEDSDINFIIYEIKDSNIKRVTDYSTLRDSNIKHLVGFTWQSERSLKLTRSNLEIYSFSNDTLDKIKNKAELQLLKILKDNFSLINKCKKECGFKFLIRADKIEVFEQHLDKDLSKQQFYLCRNKLISNGLAYKFSIVFDNSIDVFIITDSSFPEIGLANVTDRILENRELTFKFFNTITDSKKFLRKA